jgi:hypothetical protein
MVQPTGVRGCKTRTRCRYELVENGGREAVREDFWRFHPCTGSFAPMVLLSGIQATIDGFYFSHFSEPKKKKYQRESIHTWYKHPSKLSPDTFQVPPKKCSAKAPQFAATCLFSVQPLCSIDRDVYRSNGSKNVTVRYEVYSHFNNQHTKFIRHSQDLTTWSGCTHANTTRVLEYHVAIAVATSGATAERTCLRLYDVVVYTFRTG